MKGFGPGGCFKSWQFNGASLSGGLALHEDDLFLVAQTS